MADSTQLQYPQHPRALGVSRRSRGEQEQHDEQRGPSSESNHRLPSWVVVRFTLTRSVRAPGHCGISILICRDSPGSRVTLASDAEVGGCFSMLKLDISMPKRDISELKLDINILLLLYVAILIALGALGVATKADFVLAKKAKVQTTTSSGAKIDGFDVQTTTSPSVKTDGPAAQPQ
jgi:hypothetical protein